MITFKFLRFPFVVCVLHSTNELDTDIILNITNQEHLVFTLLHTALILIRTLQQRGTR